MSSGPMVSTQHLPLYWIPLGLVTGRFFNYLFVVHLTKRDPVLFRSLLWFCGIQLGFLYGQSWEDVTSI